jgi:hypothetical protein
MTPREPHEWISVSGRPWSPRVRSDRCARCGRTPDAHPSRLVVELGLTPAERRAIDAILDRPYADPDDDAARAAQRLSGRRDSADQSAPVTPAVDAGLDVERPTHPWNDPDDDGHDCADCPSDSMWKCDRLAHPLGGAYDLLTTEQQATLQSSLEENARVRRQGNANARTMPLGGVAGPEPAPALDVREALLTDIVDEIRPAISNAYYDARNAGETMEDAASRAAGTVLAVILDSPTIRALKAEGERPKSTWQHTAQKGRASMYEPPAAALATPEPYALEELLHPNPAESIGSRAKRFLQGEWSDDRPGTTPELEPHG